MYIQLNWRSQYLEMSNKKLLSNKKLYSFRATPELLKALRERADAQNTTVSDVIHTILSEGLGLPLNHTQPQSVDLRSNSMKLLMEQLKREITEELREELKGTM